MTSTAPPLIDEQAVTRGSGDFIAGAGGTTQSQFAAVYIGFISAIGLTFNFLVMMVIVVLKDYKKTTNWYVLNLAIADSLFLMLLPLNLQQNISGEWTLGISACILFQGGFYVNYYAGVLFLAVMSFDRYVAIAHPISNSWRRIRSRLGSLLLALAVWSMSIAATLPLMMNSSINDGVCDFSFEYVHPDCEAMGIHSAVRCEVFKNIGTVRDDLISQNENDLEDVFYDVFTDGYEGDYEGLDYDVNSIIISAVFHPYFGRLCFAEGSCCNTVIPKNHTPAQAREDYFDECFTEISEDYYTWIIGNFVLSFVVPLTVMACCYGGILYRLQNPKIRSSGSRRSRYGSRSSEGTSKGRDKKVRITILVVTLVVAFVICWSPLHGVILSRIHKPNLSEDACHKLRNVAVLMAYSNSFLNPILYTFLGINFGKRLKSALSRLFGKSLVSKLDWLSKKDAAPTVSANSSKITKFSLSEPVVPLATFSPRQKTDVNDDYVKIEEGQGLLVQSNSGRSTSLTKGDGVFNCTGENTTDCAGDGGMD